MSHDTMVVWLFDDWIIDVMMMDIAFIFSSTSSVIF